MFKQIFLWLKCYKIWGHLEKSIKKSYKTNPKITYRLDKINFVLDNKNELTIHL